MWPFHLPQWQQHQPSPSVAFPSATLAITSANHPIKWIQHLPQINITSAKTFGITAANTIMAITSAIKINLQFVVYKKFYKTHKHQYTWVYICKG